MGDQSGRDWLKRPHRAPSSTGAIVISARPMQWAATHTPAWLYFPSHTLCSQQGTSVQLAGLPALPMAGALSASSQCSANSCGDEHLEATHDQCWASGHSACPGHPHPRPPAPQAPRWTGASSCLTLGTALQLSSERQCREVGTEEKKDNKSAQGCTMLGREWADAARRRGSLACRLCPSLGPRLAPAWPP